MYYTSILLPVTLVRLCEEYVNSVPFSIVTISAILGSLLGEFFPEYQSVANSKKNAGVTNVFFFAHLLRRFPQSAVLPLFSAATPTVTITISYPAQAAGQDEVDKFDEAVEPRDSIRADSPTDSEAGRTFVPPDSWKTSGGHGRRP